MPKSISWFDVESWVLEHYYNTLSPGRQRGVRSIFRRHFHAARWYGIPINALQSKDIGAWFQRIKKQFPQEANHCLSLFRVCWRQGQIAGLIPEKLIAPGGLLEKVPVNRRERFVTIEEMPRLLDALDRTTPILRAFITVLLETACRSGEALHMAWGELDLEHCLWHQPGTKTKNGQPHTVVLTARAVAVLETLDRNGERPFPYSKCWFQGQWVACRKSCGLDDLTFHDLRRTRLTYLAAAGMPLKDLQRVSNHRSIVSVEPYLQQFANLEPIRTAMEKASAAMQQQGQLKAS